MIRLCEWWLRLRVFAGLVVCGMLSFGNGAMAAQNVPDLGEMFDRGTDVVNPGLRFFTGLFLLIGVVLAGMGIMKIIAYNKNPHQEKLGLGVVMLVCGGALSVLTTVMLVAPQTLGLGTETGQTLQFRESAPRGSGARRNHAVLWQGSAGADYGDAGGPADAGLGHGDRADAPVPVTGHVA